MDIKNESLEKTGRFYIEEQNETLAELDYQIPAERSMLITHTEVNERLKGEGVGQELVLKAVEFARQKGYTIKATCRFASAVLKKNNGYHDVFNAGKNNG